MILQRIVNTYAVAAALLNAAAVTFVIQQIIERYPVNHVAYNPLKLGMLVPCGWIAFLFRGRLDRRAFQTVIIASLSLGLTLFVADYFNLLVQHGRWAPRGLPDVWTPNW